MSSKIAMDEVLFQQRLENFQPEPLVNFVEGPAAPIELHMIEEDAHNVDLAKANYLNVLNCPEIKKVSEDIIRKYGVGTCGPRAFYGTTDVHLDLEEVLAKFLHLEESIVYSYGFVAISSSIAAYCKKNDVIFVDEKANFPIGQGLLAAKSKIIRFEHNNPESLRVEAEKLSKSGSKSRKFLIIEGISWETGQLANLPDFLEVAERFKMRVFLEETYSLGVFGESGRGLTEHFEIDPNRVDMIFGTLEGPIGSIGGFCAGSSLTIEHQRLSGSGYIFSASLPTYLAQACIKSLEMLANKPKKIQELSKLFYDFLESDRFDFKVLSHSGSPFQLFTSGSEAKDARIHEFCKTNGVHFIKKHNGLMINLNITLLDDESRLKKVFKVLEDAWN